MSKRNPLKDDVVSRTRLGRIIQKRADQLQLSRNAMGERVKDAPSQMSRLMTNHFNEFSVERLVRYASMLGCDVTVSVSPRVRTSTIGHVRVVETRR